MKIESLAGDGKAFGSGENNPHGPRLFFQVSEQGAVGYVNYGPEFQGWAGIVHNGMLVLGLDDVMFFALVHATDSYAMSVELKLIVEAPVLVNEDLLLLGWVSQVDGRKVYTQGEIRRRADNVLLARGLGLFILVKGREEARDSEELGQVSFNNEQAR